MWGITDDLSGAVVVQSPASLGSSIGRAPTNQTWWGVKVIIKWNTLSPQLPLGTAWLVVAAVITSDNINHYDQDLQ